MGTNLVVVHGIAPDRMAGSGRRRSAVWARCCPRALRDGCPSCGGCQARPQERPRL